MKKKVTNLPVDVTTWIKENEPNDKIIAEDLKRQIWFINDILCKDIMFGNYKYGEYEQPKVISTYLLNSTVMPVYQINAPFYGLEIVIKSDFNEWIISVKSAEDKDYKFMHLFDTQKEIEPCLCDGFPKEKVFGSYEKDHTKFTAEFDGAYKLISFFKFLKIGK